jgi:hypothetical protein
MLQYQHPTLLNVQGDTPDGLRPLTFHPMNRYSRIAAKYLALSLLFFPFGVLCHELIGHGLVGVIFGGRITEVDILGVRIWPVVRFVGWSGRYGECDVLNMPTRTGEAVMSLGGSMSTFCVATTATFLLWRRRWGNFVRPVLITISLWWIDLFTYMLPSWGLPRSIFWGQRHYSEPFEAAISLGMPGAIFQILVVASCLTLLGSLILRLALDSKTELSA